MTLTESLTLGLTQGLTEFLPVSSTAHLRIVPALLRWPDAGAAFTAVLQLGTLAAVIGFFLRELLGMARALLDPERRGGPEARRLLYLVVGTLPIGLAGLAFRHSIEGPLRTIPVIATSLIVVGVAMGVMEGMARREKPLEGITLRDALIIGLAQALALIPGVSRSGITLLAGMGVGLRRDAAARFSFLLSIPAVAAAGVFELPKVLRAHDVAGGTLLAGLLVAALTGYFTIGWMLRFVRTRTLFPFVVYRVLFGIFLLTGAARGWF